MDKIIKTIRIPLALILIFALAAGGWSYYRSRSTKLLDRESFKEFRDSLNELEESEDGGFKSQDELRDYIKDWADTNSLEYTVDDAGNIIFDRPSEKRKKNVTPTLIGVSMNYETALSNASLLASAASIALSDVESGRRTVVFFDDEQNLGKGYKGIDKSYITDKSKIIYMDQGSSMYMSTSSFRQVFSKIIVPAEREESDLDTAVTVKISGIRSDEIGTGISKQPDPISAASTLLTRLKNKSSICRLADIKVQSNGNMYPTGIEITFTMNSYAVSSFTAYIDKRIKAWDKAYSERHEGLEYTYEVINDADSLPKKVYTKETTDRLTSVLYTVNTGTYRYQEGDPVPEDKEEGDIFGINCATGINASKDKISISFITEGRDEMYTDRITSDNMAAAELYGCEYKTGEITEAFSNEKNSLSNTFAQTYHRVNEKISSGSSLDTISDNYFTPCAYLAARNKKADIIHLRLNPSNAANISNTVLCYIKAKGNTSIFG